MARSIESLGSFLKPTQMIFEELRVIQLHIGYGRGIAPATRIALVNGVRNGRGSNGKLSR